MIVRLVKAEALRFCGKVSQDFTTTFERSPSEFGNSWFVIKLALMFTLSGLLVLFYLSWFVVTPWTVFEKHK